MNAISSYLYIDWIIYSEKITGFLSTEYHSLIKNLQVQLANAPRKENLDSGVSHGFQGFVHSF